MRAITRSTVGLLVGSLVVVGGATSVVAATTSSSDNEEIRACVRKSDGDVRIIKGHKCRDGERYTDWDEKGERGKTGATGAQGLPGPTLTSGRATATANTFGLTSAYTNVPGLSVALPAAGTYTVSADVRGIITSNKGLSSCFIVARLADSVAGAVPDSERLVIIEIGRVVGNAGKNAQETVPIQEIVTVAGPRTIQVQALKSGCAAPTTGFGIASNADGRSTLNFVKIA